jgi:hypothetical protein
MSMRAADHRDVPADVHSPRIPLEILKCRNRDLQPPSRIEYARRIEHVLDAFHQFVFRRAYHLLQIRLLEQADAVLTGLRGAS